MEQIGNRQRRFSLSKQFLSRFLALCVFAFACSAAAVWLYPGISGSKYVFNFNLTSNLYRYRIILIRWLLLLPPFMLVLSWPLFGFRKVNDFLHRHRFLIGALIVLAAVVLNINGSSLNIWNGYLQGDESDGIVFGEPRTIRSDEWVVNTPRAFSQSYNGHGYFNALYGNQPSDMFIIKDTPVWALAEIFRPFHWGYLVLGNSRGLAFYWSARLVVLFLATYELCLLLTEKKNRGVAVIGASLVTFAPFIQWWLAVNSLPEMLIAAFVSIVLLNRYLTDHSSMHRALCALVIMICAGMFILCLYPAWQIPLFYVLAALIIWQIVKYWGNIRVSRKDVLNLVWIVALFVVVLGSVLVMSSSTIRDTMHTLYPGRREVTGGDLPWAKLMGGIGTLILPFRSHPDLINPTETALFIDLFPIGLLVTVFNCVKKRSCDVLDALLVCILALDVIYSCVGLPLWLAKILILTPVSGGRMVVGMAVINIILLVKSLYERTWRLPVWATCVCALVYAALSTLASKECLPHKTGNDPYMSRPILALVFIIGVIFVLALLLDTAILKKTMTILMVATLACSGLAVNPTQYASRAIDSQPIISEIEKIDPNKKGVWATTEWIYPQLLAANGIQSVNTVNVTPNWKLWKKLDPNGKNQRFYNRYAFLDVHFTGYRADGTVKYKKSGEDHIQIFISPKQAHKIGINYILTGDDLSTIHDSEYEYLRMGDKVSGLYVYRLVHR